MASERDQTPDHGRPLRPVKTVTFTPYTPWRPWRVGGGSKQRRERPLHRL